MLPNTPSSAVESLDGEFITAGQLAEKLRISRSTIEKHTAKRQVPGQTQIGRTWRYSVREVEKRLRSGLQFFIIPEANYTARTASHFAVAELPAMYGRNGK